MTNDYKNYSLEKLSELVQDALQTEATPKEIYDTIITTLKKEVSYHDVCKRQAQDVLNLMQTDNDIGGFKVEDYEIEHPYADSFISASDDTVSFAFKENIDDNVVKFSNQK